MIMYGKIYTSRSFDRLIDLDMIIPRKVIHSTGFTHDHMSVLCDRYDENGIHEHTVVIPLTKFESRWQLRKKAIKHNNWSFYLKCNK